MQTFLEYVLQAYEIHGADELLQGKLPDLLRIKFGGTNDAKAKLGSIGSIREAFLGVQEELYRR